MLRVAALLVLSLQTPIAAAEKPTAPAPVSAEEAIAAAKGWLGALKEKAPAQVTERTSFPFQYRSTRPKKRCEGTAADAKKLTAIVDCMVRRDTILMEELHYATDLQFKPFDPKNSPELVNLVGKLAEGERVVETFINGDGIVYSFALVVKGEGGAARVKAFLVDAELHE